MSYSPIDKFLKKAEEKAFSEKHRKTIAYNMGKYDVAVERGKKQFKDLDKAKKLAKNIRWLAVEQLPKWLEQFEKKFTARGNEVIWAENVEEAQTAIKNIVQKYQAKTVVKSKSMATEEIELNPLLESLDVDVLETDLGEFIVQLMGQKPYHIVTPAMHLSKDDIAEFFHHRFGTPRQATAEELTAFARQYAKEYFLQADIGISGGNFLVANTGSLALVENEGNARLSTTLPRIHIAIVGIEKVIPSLKHLSLLLPLLATHGTGQQMTTYNTIISDSKKENEADGVEKIYVVLLDNGRTELLANPQQREALYCIRCGACLNACPVYHNIGGHSYDTVYSGPIGSVIMPQLDSFEDFGHLSHASSLCGKCGEVCPINIDLPQLLLNNRQEEQHLGLRPRSESKMWKNWRRVMASRTLLNAPQWGKQWVWKMTFQKSWGERRKPPKFPKKTFNQLWRKGIN